MGKWVLPLAACFFLFGAFVRADEPLSDLSNLGLAFNAENQVLSGDWPGMVSWHRHICDGYYRYDVKFQARVEDDTGFEFNEDNSVTVHGDFTNVWAGVDGGWKSRFTACREVSGWLGVLTDWVKVESRVVFPNADQQKLSSVSVEILSSDFGPMHLGKHAPSWLEAETRGLVQREFPKFWQRHLRDWVNAWLQKRSAERFHANL